MRIVATGGEVIDFGVTEAKPTIGITDYSRRVTDDFGVTTVVERGFARRMSVRLALPTDMVDMVQHRLAALRASAATWIADDRYQSLSVRGFYKDFSLDLAVPPLSYCTLTVEGLTDTEPFVDPGGDPAPEGSASTLRMLRPTVMTDAGLVASSVAETDYAEWAAQTSYPIGARVIKAATHRIYESAAAANAGNDPAGATGKWFDVGPTNRWAMFDQALGSVTSAAGMISATVKVGTIDAVALLDVVGATVRVQAPGYDRTLAVGVGAVTFLDLPTTADQVTVTIAGSGTVSVGTLMIGRLLSLGLTEASPTSGIIDYSTKSFDDFGEPMIVERAWAKRMSVAALIRSDAVDVVENRIASVRAQPSLWIGGVGMDSLTVYGFFKDFSIEVDQAVSKLTLSIEGLSTAGKVAPITAIVDWPTVGDSAGTKPDDNATDGAPADSLVAGVPAQSIVRAVTDASGNLLLARDLKMALDAAASAIATANAAVAAAMTQAENAMSAVTAAGGDISSLQTLVQTQGAQISSNTTAITNTAGSLALLTTKVFASGDNLVTNSTFENGLADWIADSAVWTSPSAPTDKGTFAVTYENGAHSISHAFPIAVGGTYTASADMAFDADAGTFSLQIQWFDAGGGYIGGTLAIPKTRGVGFGLTLDDRIRVTGTAPPNTATGLLVVATGAVAGNRGCYVRKCKVERGTVMSPYSQEASIVSSYKALSTLNTQYASLTTTVTTQGASITLNAGAVSSLGTNVATLSSNLATQGGLISSLQTLVDQRDQQLATRASSLETTLNTPTSGVLARLTTNELASSTNSQALSSLSTVLEASINTGGNLLPNSTFLTTSGWGIYNTTGDSFFGLNIAGDSWHPVNENALSMNQDTGNSGQDLFWFSDVVPIRAGSWYQISCYVASHRADAGIGYEFWDATNTSIRGGGTDRIYRGSGANGGQDLRSWDLVYLNFYATDPLVKLILHKWGTNNGETSSYAWFCRPQLIQVANGDAPLQPYGPGSGTAVLANALARVATTETAIVDQANKYAAAAWSVEALTPGGRAALTVRSSTNGGAGIDIVGDVTFAGSLNVGPDSGQRTKITNSGVTVYDATGMLRARLGLW